MKKNLKVVIVFFITIIGCSAYSVSRRVMASFYPQTPVIQNEFVSFKAYMPQNREKDGIYGPFFQLIVELTNESETPVDLILDEFTLNIGDKKYKPQPLSVVKASYPKQNDYQIRSFISDAFFKPGHLDCAQTRKGTLYFNKKAAKEILRLDHFQIEYSNLSIIFLKKK